MITLYLLNKLYFIVNYVLSSFWSGSVYQAIQNLGSNLSALTVPVTLVDILQLCILFLPTATIAILFNITMALFVIRFVFGLIHFVAHIGGIR